MKKPFVIGIAGGSASGKTTFTKHLEEALEGISLQILHMDSYFKPKAERPQSPAPVSGKVYMDDNHPETMDLDRLSHDLSDLIAAAEVQVIIVEGLLTLWHEEICRLLDLKLFVECRADERIVRRLRRNMGWGLSFDEIADVYLDLVRYRHDEYVEPSKWKADFILNGSNDTGVALRMIAKYVRDALKAE
ncbi:MAG: AAA family ATPase [Clostridia bacterium]|nr:AAA family ATPase [Clostridia bacterium]